MSGSREGPSTQAQVDLDRPVEIPRLVASALLIVDAPGLRRPFVIGEARRHEHERLDRLGSAERQVERDVPALREADERGALALEVREQRFEVAHVRERAGGKRRVPVSPHVVADDTVPFGECVDLLVPHACVGDARVQQHDRRSFAAFLVPEPRAFDVREHRRRVPPSPVFAREA